MTREFDVADNTFSTIVRRTFAAGRGTFPKAPMPFVPSSDAQSLSPRRLHETVPALNRLWRGPRLRLKWKPATEEV